MKRTLSLILSLAMLISLLPSIAIFASAEDVSYTYSFIGVDYHNPIPGDGSHKLTYNGLPRYGEYSSGEYAEGERNWKYHGMDDDVYANWETSVEKNPANDGRSVAGFDTGGILFIPTAKGDWFTLQFRVPEAGLYKLSYIAPIAESKAFNSSLHIGVFSTYYTEARIEASNSKTQNSSAFMADKINLNENLSASKTSLTYVDVGTNVIPINEAGGEAVISFTTTDNASSTVKNRIRLRGFKLTKVSDELLLSSDEVILGEGEEQTVTASLKENTTVKTIGASYEIEDSGIATVSAAGKITPVSAGWTTLTVTLGDMTKKIVVGVKDSSGVVPGKKPNFEPELSFPGEFIHVGESIKITNANSSYSFTSSDSNVATVSEDGTVTAVKTGKVTVTATKGEIEKSFDIPIVGENLINRNGIDHGHFENGIYFSDGSDAQDKNATFWEATRKDVGNVFDYSTPSVTLPGRKDPVKAARFTFDGNGTPAANGRISIVLQAPKALPTSANTSRGMIIADANKMYELTGWIAAENTEVLADMWNMVSYFDCVGSTYTEIYGQSIKPWDNKSGNQPWQMFNTSPVIIDPTTVTQVAIRPVMQSIAATKIGDILATEFSIHEVVYDRMELTADKTEIAASETATLSAKHFSNTGNAIKEISSKKPVDAVVPVTYESLNPDIVRVMDDNGTIIGVSDGTAVVKATATICGVTVTEEIEITVSGGERPEFIGSLELEIIGENIYPATYATTIVTVKNEAGEVMELDASEITYKSSNTEIADIAPNGVIRAKNAGEATITASATRFGLEKSATAKIVVNELPPETDFPEVIGAYFTTDHTYVGGENTIVVKDLYGRILGGGVTYGYEIADESIISESDGIFTGKKIGRTSVKVSATLDGVTRETEIPAVVVGENLLIRMGVNHGEFENGIYLNDKSADTVQYSSFWTASHNDTREVFTYELLRNQFSEITGMPTNIAKLTMPDGRTPSGGKLIRIIGAKSAYSESTGRHTGLVTVDANKLYEYTGYIKTENTKTLPEDACGTLGYQSGADANAVELRGFKSYPWKGKSGDQPWSKFNVSPVLMNWRSVGTYSVRPGVDALSLDDNNGYELYISHLSLHEVVFDAVSFTASGDFANAKTYDTFETIAFPVSNTGAEIVSGNEAGTIPITYSSDNENVARISEDGVITAVSDGTCKIYASATILGVTKTAEIEVSFSGLDVTFDRVEAAVPKTLNVGSEISAPAKLLNTDGSAYEGEAEIYWEIEDGSIASVTQDGVIRAKKSGTTVINIYALVGDRTVSTSYNIKVYDVTPLDTVIISGANTVEQGFKLQLEAQGYHESGSPADMNDCTVKFELSDKAFADIISITESGSVTALNVGTAAVIATVTASDGSSAVSDAFEITVSEKSPKSKFIDFRIYPVRSSPLGATSLDKDGWIVNEEKSAPGLVSGGIGNFQFIQSGIVAKVPAHGYVLNADTTLDIKIDYDGWYEIDFMGAQQSNGAYLAYIYMDGSYMGRYIFQDPEGKEGPVLALNTMYLTAGTHQFTIRTIEGETHKRTQHFGYLSFKYLAENKEDVTVNKPVFHVEQTSLAVGEAVDAPVEVTLSNGRTHNFGLLHGQKQDTASNIKVTSNDASVAEYIDGRIVAKKEGTATLVAKALVYGVPSESTLEITVTDEKLSRVEGISAEGISLYVGEFEEIGLRAFVKNAQGEEREVDTANLKLSYELIGDDIAEISDHSITATAQGSANLAVTATLDGENNITAHIPVTVLADGYASVTLGAVSQVIRFGSEGTDLIVKAYDNFGKEMNSDGATAVYTVTDENIFTVSENGRVTPGSEGVAEVMATVTIDGITHKSNWVTISVRNGKVGSTYYTPEHIAAARENVKKYDWAKSSLTKAVSDADKYLEYVEEIYDMIPSHDLYRLTLFTDEEDPAAYLCTYCGVNVVEKYGNKEKWNINMLTRPWKVQCAECKRLFPSNDFASFYAGGLDEHHEFNRQLALENNGILCGRGERNENGEYIVYEQYADNPYGYGDPNGNLYNELYNELYASGIDPRKKTPITQGWISEEAAEAQGIGYFWGVDDGKGYDTGNTHENGIREVYRYAGVINYGGIWYWHGKYDTPIVHAALTAFRDAYLYTGEKKYGIAGAIILDRVADVYPDMDYNIDCLGLDSLGHVGKVSGYIHENFVNRVYTTAYDAFFDCYDEPKVIEFLSRKAKEWKLDNKKTNGELIRQNAEDNILLETWTAVKQSKIRGNFGFPQYTLPLAAVILDREPETSDMIEYTMQPWVRTITLQEDTPEGERIEYDVQGTGLYDGLMNNIDRDGYGNEGSLSYNGIFSNNFVSIIDLFDRYGKVEVKYDLSRNPKGISALTLGGADVILAGVREPNIADQSEVWAKTGITDNSALWMLGLQLTDNPIFAQMLYLKNGNSSKGLKGDIFTKDPEAIADKVQAIIDEYGELDLSKSSITTGYGLAALRDGVLYDNVTSGTRENTMRDWWMYFGMGATNHKHMDALNLGLDAFGLNFAPDHGYYPSDGTGETRRVQWNFGTTSHNTVVVDDQSQIKGGIYSYPLHFDDAGSVKVMDVDAKNAYEVTDIYRRTVVSVDIDDNVSYALDFFRIKGGDEHVYSFHSQSEESTVSGVEMVKQPRGTYAGMDVPFGDLTYPKDCGYNWMPNVERAVYPETGEFSIDFKVTDYRKLIPGNRNFHLKLTQLNGFDISEVATADGTCIPIEKNPEYQDYLLVRRSGKNLDTLFTSVIEPYEDSSKIKSLTRVDVVRKDGGEIKESDAVAAIRVELHNGRVDYVVYSARNDVEYRVADLFNFTGFVGVYSVSATDSADVVRTYINDGTKIGETTMEYAAVTGTVVDFTDSLNYEDGEPVFDNFVEVTAPADVTPENLVGRMLVVNNDGVQNGAYVIQSAERYGDNILIGTGDVSFFRSLAADNIEEFVWNIERGQTYEIPMSTCTDESPKISVPGTYTTTVGSSITIPLTVESDREYTLTGTTLPRGMSLDAESGKLMWTPTASQIGDNHVAVTVDNGVLSDTVHFIVTVYGATTGGTQKPTTPPEPSIPATPSTPTIPATPGASDNKPGTTPSVGDADSSPEATPESVRFIDLGNHTWAADAINSLADEGIIKGTTPNTFSPAANITRADFAILLVRAFELASENEENFADVLESDYFAKELAVARNTGIVNGIGENKFAPRNNITRQDMMVIVYRALKSSGVELDKRNDTQVVPYEEYSDNADVSEYAHDAVAALVNAKLVNGKNGLIDPLANTTRAEVAVLIKRILDYIK